MAASLRGRELGSRGTSTGADSRLIRVSTYSSEVHSLCVSDSAVFVVTICRRFYHQKDLPHPVRREP
jgi:hypothetical protein